MNKYTEMNCNRAVGREFKVNVANIRQWRLEKNRLQQLPTKKMAETIHPQMEVQLNAWIQDARQQGVGVSMAEVLIKAKIIAKQTKIANFKASQEWCYRFFWRHNLHVSLKRRIHIAQRLPEDNEDKVTDFQRFIIQQRKWNYYAPTQIGNAERTPLTFNIPYTTTIATKRDKSTSIKTTGNEKNRFKVMLTSSLRGKLCLKRSFQTE